VKREGKQVQPCGEAWVDTFQQKTSGLGTKNGKERTLSTVFPPEFKKRKGRLGELTERGGLPGACQSVNFQERKKLVQDETHGGLGANSSGKPVFPQKTQLGIHIEDAGKTNSGTHY